MRALCGGGEGRTGAHSGGAGFSFFARHANKTKQNASVVVAESSGMWLDEDALTVGLATRLFKAVDETEKEDTYEI